MFNQKEYQKKYKEEHKIQIKDYYQQHKEEMKKSSTEYYMSHKEEIKKYHKEHQKEDNNYSKEYYLKNKEKIAIHHKEYYELNKNQIIQYQSKYISNKIKNNVEFKILCNLRSRVRDAIKGNNKSKKTVKLIGCSLEFLKVYLASKFTSGMTWNNYGKWHIDHIRPCASFDLSKSSEQHRCFHYTNLQPLWAKDNLIKSNKFYQKY
jgi:hypothetical protein